MTELICWPLDNKQYTSVALGAAYAARSRGVLNADSFAAKTNGNNTVTVGKGVGCIHVSDQWAAFPFSQGDVTLTFEDADGVNPRWDAIALVYDKNANTAGLEVRKGTASASPTLPSLRRSDDYDEIFLYRVTRPTGATKISADNVVDLRLDGSVCGLMRDTIDAVDTSVMEAAFEAFLQKIEAELNQLNAGTSAMMRATYDPQGRQTDIFKAIDKVSKTAYARGAKLTGTMPNNGAVAGKITQKDGKYTIPMGFHDGSGSAAIDETEQAKLVPANIREGVNILGVEGSMSSSEGMKPQAKSVTPTFEQQTVLPDSAYNCLSQVTVAAIPTNYVDNAAGGQTLTVGG